MPMLSMRLAAIVAGIGLTLPAAADTRPTTSASPEYKLVPRSQARVVTLRGKHDKAATTSTVARVAKPGGVSQSINAPLSVNRDSNLFNLQAPLTGHSSGEAKQ